MFTPEKTIKIDIPVADTLSDNYFTLIYRNNIELTDFLVDYFISGLENNELCILFMPETVDIEKIKLMFHEKGMNVNPYIQSLQLEFIPMDPSIFPEGETNTRNIKDILEFKQEYAVLNGFSGVRFNVNMHDIKEPILQYLNSYRESIECFIYNKEARILCTCPIDSFSADEIFDMMDQRENFILKRDGKWMHLKDLLSSKYRTHLRYSPEMMKKEKEVKSVYRNSPAVAFLWEHEGFHPVKFVSENISQFGYSIDDFILNRILYEDIIHPGDLVEYYTELQRCIEEGSNEFTKEYRILDSRGQVHWVNERSLIGSEKKGANYRYQGIVVNISEKKAAEKALQGSEEKFKKVFDNSNDAIYLLDLEGHFLEVNKVAHQQLGYTHDEMLEMKIQDTYTSYYTASFHERVAEICKNEHAIFEVVRSKKDGSSLPIEMSASLLEYDGNKAILVISRDIAERKKAEKMLLNAKMNAEAANKAKSEFLANMSHELRTPLNAIIGFSDLMLEETYGILNKEQKRHVQNVSHAGKHLLNIINDILDISKMEAGKMNLHYEDFFVYSALHEVTSIIAHMASKKNLKLTTAIKPLDIQINADRGKFKQILYNLISNAIKFTPEGGSIIVRTECKTDSVVVLVEDTGIGISKENIGKLFQPFTQLESSSTRQNGGTGLGLVLIKKFVEMHGGNVWVTSEPGIGSTFSFEIPVNGLKFTETEIVSEDNKIVDNKKLSNLNAEKSLKPLTCLLRKEEKVFPDT
ncbi:PAS domain S-box protein [Methanolobus sp. ZRKC3]|uniref:PAS domain S-box protein n=1 Tax=Methanolobus sp. ZRKC3 TaxID=3125786 RepID=UPI0032532521